MVKPFPLTTNIIPTGNWYGNTSTQSQTLYAAVPTLVPYLSIANKSGGSITLNIYIVIGSTAVLISPKDFPLAANELFIFETTLFLNAYEAVFFTTSGSADYFATIAKP